MLVQWKDTTVCLDFYCECGAHGHFDYTVDARLAKEVKTLDIDRLGTEVPTDS